MNVFWQLVLAHLLADFTFQTNFIARWKRQSPVGGAVHSLMFFLFGALLTFPRLGEPWAASLSGWAALGGLTVLHFLEDEWRVWTIQKRNSPDSTFFFLWDQFVHLALIFVFFPGQVNAIPETWVLLAILFVLTTHFTSVLVYFLEKDIYGSATLEGPGKYYAMAERTVTGLALLLPGWWALSFLGVTIAAGLVRRRRHDTVSPVSIIAGTILAVIFGFTARTVFYR